MPKSATSPKSLNERLAKYRRDATAAAYSRWRSWVEALADGGAVPEPGELLEVAQLLRVRDPARQLEADAGALAEHRTCERLAVSCRATAAEKVKPHGSLDRLRKTIADMEAELERLRQLRDDLEGECCAGHWTNRAWRLRHDHPLLWPPAGAIDNGSIDNKTIVEILP